MKLEKFFSAVKLPLKNDILCAESLYHGKFINCFPVYLVDFVFYAWGFIGGVYEGVFSFVFSSA